MIREGRERGDGSREGSVAAWVNGVEIFYIYIYRHTRVSILISGPPSEQHTKISFLLLALEMVV